LNQIYQNEIGKFIDFICDKFKLPHSSSIQDIENKCSNVDEELNRLKDQINQLKKTKLNLVIKLLN
jgi:hypothetical protein